MAHMVRSLHSDEAPRSGFSQLSRPFAMWEVSQQMEDVSFTPDSFIYLKVTES